MPRIAIDYTPAYEQGAGIGRLVRELVKALAYEDTLTEYRLFVSGAKLDDLPSPPSTNFTWRPTRVNPKWLARIWHRLHWPVPVQIFTGDVDLYHATDFVLPPVRAGTKTLLTVHDLSFMRVPEAASPRLRAYLNDVVPRSTRRATHIIADSSATKADLIDVYKLSPEKITVLLSGVDPRFKPFEGDTASIRDKYGIPSRPYIFSVGTVQPRKNYGRVIEALAILRNQGRDVGLVIAGGRGWLEDPIYATIKNARMSDYVHLIGFADDADLPALYSDAVCMAYPSLYEGFGFPILEGMACGTPVVTANVSSLPEVAGDAAILVDPYDTDAIADALRRVIDETDLRDRLIQRGLKQIKFFTWERSARQLLELYYAILQEMVG